MKAAKIQEVEMPVRLLRRQEVQAMCGFQHTLLYQMMREGTFPQPLKLPNSKSVRWRLTDVLEWIAGLETRAERCERMNAESVTKVDKPDEIGAQRGKRGRPAKRVAEAV
jgi:predicted DNA-binding transcriptional regulator AlpA